MTPLRELHEWLAWIVVISNGAAGLWATAGHWLESVRNPVMWLVTHSAHRLVGLQVIVGTLLVAGRTDEAAQTHMFYGFLTFVGVGLIVAYRHLSEYKHLLYGLGSLFIMGLAIRAMTLEPLVGS